MSKAFRSGAVGALMDEYERASDELAQLILHLTDAEFEAVRDRQTPDEECRSIRTVINHVVRASYGYAHYMRVAFSLPSPRIVVPLGARSESVEQLAAMLAYTVETLDGRWEMPDAEMEAVKIQSRWGTVYDLEQMLEHAIVHILRHRRQIERFLSEPRFTPAGTAG